MANIPLENFVAPISPTSELQTKIDAIITHLLNYPPPPSGFFVARCDVDVAWEIVFERLKLRGYSVWEDPRFYFIKK